MSLEDYMKSLTEIRTKGDLPVVIKGHRELSVLAAPYGGHLEGKDADGEYFSENTDFMVDVGEKRPALYYHGKTPRGTNMLRPAPVGKGVVDRRDEAGLWMDVSLQESDPLADRIWDFCSTISNRCRGRATMSLARGSPRTAALRWTRKPSMHLRMLVRKRSRNWSIATKSSLCFGTAHSAALVGVGARASAARSISVQSVS